MTGGCVATHPQNIRLKGVVHKNERKSYESGKENIGSYSNSGRNLLDYAYLMRNERSCII